MHTTQPRGFTLIELLVAATVSIVVVSGVFMAVNSQQRAYYDGHRQRASQASLRDALMELERTVSLTGYGMDATLAIDFGLYCPTCVRDAVDAADELVVLHRDSVYWTPNSFTAEPRGHAWLIPAPGATSTGLTASTVTLNARVGDRFSKGQILQAVCRGAAVYAYFTVGATTALVTVDGPLTVTLEPAVKSDPFRQQGWASDVSYSAINECFNSGQTRVFLIHRSRFHITPVQAGGTTIPYLMLDRGIDANFDDAIDANDEVVVAEGIETFQVAYVMNSTSLPPRGTNAGTAIAFTAGALANEPSSGADTITTTVFPGTADGEPPTSESVYAPSSSYGHPYDATVRRSDHQGNILAIRIALVARSPDPDPSATAGEPAQQPFNMNGQPSWIDPNVRYARTAIQTTIPVRNMLVRGMNDF